MEIDTAQWAVERRTANGNESNHAQQETRKTGGQTDPVKAEAVQTDQGQGRADA